MLELTQIKKAYGKSTVLCGVDLEISQGECVCLAGANAAGKTTLLRIAVGLLKPDAGSVRCSGKIGFVPQQTQLLEDLTVRENLLLWYAANRLPADHLFSETSTEYLLGLKKYSAKKVGKLSGGFQKRVAIAVALVGNPQWLVMDEPFVALDLPASREIAGLLVKLKSEGKGIFFSSHIPAGVAATADKVVLLDEGKIKEQVRLSGTEEQKIVRVSHLLSGV